MTGGDFCDRWNGPPADATPTRWSRSTASPRKSSWSAGPHSRPRISAHPFGKSERADTMVVEWVGGRAVASEAGWGSPFVTNILQIFHEYFTNSSRIVHKYFTNSLTRWAHYFILCFPSIFGIIYPTGSFGHRMWATWARPSPLAGPGDILTRPRC